MNPQYLTLSQFQNFIQLESDIYSDTEQKLEKRLKVKLNKLSDEKRDNFNDDVRELAKERLTILWEEEKEHLNEDQLYELHKIWGI
ncbi:MAG: hypothetical protein C0175_00535 [Caldisericum exile]|uniref:Uncharacterized protein n=1 Tax=Caldisericum exile TaxID=693075 RepID=A0A2J6X9R1_9BACT|nr:MAG: hypothetical protein C0175_00535 [Caldisericum exile]